jgi:hypothetical protein
MSRVLGSLLISTVLTSVVMAQPGPYAPAPAPAPQPYPPQPQPYPPQPYPQPQPYAPQPYAYQPQAQVQLSAEDAEIWNRGPINEGAHIGGGLVALFFGFGIGQAVQGRYGDTGWIFTVGELGSGALMIYGITQLIDDCFEYDYECDDNDRGRGTGPLIVGALALTGFRIWEVVDAFAGPASHNRRYKNIQMRVQGYAPPQWGIYSARTMDRQATVTGLELRF